MFLNLGLQTRMMAQKKSVNPNQYSGFFDCLLKIPRQEGILALYKVAPPSDHWSHLPWTANWFQADRSSAQSLVRCLHIGSHIEWASLRADKLCVLCRACCHG